MVNCSPCGPWTTNDCPAASTLTTAAVEFIDVSAGISVERTVLMVEVGVDGAGDVAIGIDGDRLVQIEVDALTPTGAPDWVIDQRR